jgi:hypothetical protein
MVSIVGVCPLSHESSALTTRPWLLAEAKVILQVHSDSSVGRV